MADTERKTGTDGTGWPWDSADPRTPSLASFPGGPPLSFENSQKLLDFYHDMLDYRDWLRHRPESVREE